MKRISAYEIALSAIACAIATVALTVGTLYPTLLFTGYLLACFAMMIPLSKKYYVGCALAYVGSSLLALLFDGFRFFDLLPFFLFFGLHPLVNALQLKLKINRWVAWAVKAAWFDGAMYLTWRFVFGMTTSVAFIDRYIVPVLLIGGTAFFLVYDYLIFCCQTNVCRLVNRIIKK